MKASRFTDAQKAFILKQGEEGVPVAEVCRTAGISLVLKSLDYRWVRHGSIEPTSASRVEPLKWCASSIMANA